MIIFLCILGWIACGFLAVWMKYAIIDQREFDMPLTEASVMSMFGVSLLIVATVVAIISVATRSGGKILWRAKE